MRFVLSTIGTSILTNSIERATEGNRFTILANSANLKEDELSAEDKEVIDELAARAKNKLRGHDVNTHRWASAELNGIYGIYDGTFPSLAERQADQHYLICTDTFQGETTGNLIKAFLRRQGFNQVFVETPTGLSTKDTTSFTEGTKELLKWLEDNVGSEQHRDYQVIFNLVGGFKSLQGYMQTFGAFYADESVYIFERSSELIKIPRMPIQIDSTEIQKSRGQFAMMAAEAPCLMTEVKNVEEISKPFLYTMEEGGEAYVGLSEWGTLIWNRTKEDLLETDSDTIQHDLSPNDQAQLALMNAGKQYPEYEIGRGIPEALLKSVQVNGTTCVELSVWGKMVWDHANLDVPGRTPLLGGIPLLPFPRLQPTQTFFDDFTDQNTPKQRCKLQETLAKVAYLLDKHSGNTAKLKTDGCLLYDRYNNIPGEIDHFRVDGGRRVSCKPDGGNLILRHCGPHDYVNDNP